MVSAAGAKQSRATGQARREAILAAIADYWSDYNRPPSIAELARAVGVRSKNAVREHVDAMVEGGILAKAPLRLTGLRPEVVKFGIDGSIFEVELNEEKAEELRRTLAPYIVRGRRAT